MAFFKSLFKKGESPPPASVTGFPGLYDGMKAEVLTLANALIFVGRLRLSGPTQVDVLTGSETPLPRGVYNQPLKLRCFQKNGDTLTLTGTLGPSGPKFWQVEDLQILQSSEVRNFYRQSISAEGTVLTDAGEKLPCRLLDVGGGGVRLLTEKLFSQEDTFQLEVSLLPTEEPFDFTCQVRRVSVHPQAASPTEKYEYGCQFMEVSPREQERLLQVVFVLQRKTLQSRRDQ